MKKKIYMKLKLRFEVVNFQFTLLRSEERVNVQI